MKFDINSVAAVLCTISFFSSLSKGNFGMALILAIIGGLNYAVAIKNARKDVD